MIGPGMAVQAEIKTGERRIIQYLLSPIAKRWPKRGASADVPRLPAATGDRLLMKDWFNSYKKIEWLVFADGQALRIADFQTFIAGTSGADTIIGTEGRDFVVAGDGDDWLSLLGGDDVGVGGKGKDFVSGDDDNDLLVGGDDDDHVMGGRGSDVLTGDAGADDIYGGDHADVIAGGRGDGDLMAGGDRFAMKNRSFARRRRLASDCTKLELAA